MEALWIRDRTRLWQMSQEHPDWMSEAVGRCPTWVKKWRRRFAEEPPEAHPRVFYSRSRAPYQPRRKVTDAIRERILAIRDTPPDDLRRVPGPQAILYFLHRQVDLVADREQLPRSAGIHAHEDNVGT